MGRLANRVKVATTTTGTGTINLGAADPGYQSFTACTTGDIVSYVIEDPNTSGYEVGTGTYTAGSPGTLSRTTIFNSSNANAAISLSGNANVRVYIAPNELDFEGLEVRNPAVTAPQTGVVRLVRKDFGRQMLGAVDFSGVDHTLQPHMSRKPLAYLTAYPNSATLPAADGIAAPAAIGTPTARAQASTNLATRARRIGYISSATAGNLAGIYWPTLSYTIGDGAGLGGFHMMLRFGTSDAATVSGARMFVGLANSTAAPTNVEPNTLTNVIGVAGQSSTSNLAIVYGGTTAQTAIDLGTNFPSNTLSADFYSASFFSSPLIANTVYYTIERLSGGTAFISSGKLTAATAGTQLPSSTVFMAPRIWRSNNATASAVGIDFGSLYIETDN